MHRRFLNPTVQNTKILNSFYPNMNETMRILVDKLGKRDPNEIFDIYETLEACSFDMFASKHSFRKLWNNCFDPILLFVHSENTFGVDLNVQNNEHNLLFQMANEYELNWTLRVKN